MPCGKENLMCELTPNVSEFLKGAIILSANFYSSSMLLIWKAGREKQKEIFHPLVYSPAAHGSWGQVKGRTLELILGLKYECLGPNDLDRHQPLPRVCISWELESEADTGLESRHLHRRLRHPKWHFRCYTKCSTQLILCFIPDDLLSTEKNTVSEAKQMLPFMQFVFLLVMMEQGIDAGSKQTGSVCYIRYCQDPWRKIRQAVKRFGDCQNPHW